MLNFRILLCLLMPIFVLSSIGSAASQVSGAQCRNHLEPLTLLLKRHYAKFYYEVNNEITNVLGTPLVDIATYKAETRSAQTFVQMTRVAIKGCSSNCGTLFNCNDLGASNVLSLNLNIKAIDPTNVVTIEDDKAVISIEKDLDSSKPVVSDSKIRTFSHLYPTREECIGDEDSELCKHYDWSSDTSSQQNAEISSMNKDINCIFDEACMSELMKEEVEEESNVFESLAPNVSPVTSEI